MMKNELKEIDAEIKVRKVGDDDGGAVRFGTKKGEKMNDKKKKKKKKWKRIYYMHQLTTGTNLLLLYTTCWIHECSRRNISKEGAVNALAFCFTDDAG